MEMPLLGRGRGKPFAPLRGFWLWLRLGRLLDFFSAFVFASHVCKCATKEALEESAKRRKAYFYGLCAGKGVGLLVSNLAVSRRNPRPTAQTVNYGFESNSGQAVKWQKNRMQNRRDVHWNAPFPVHRQ
jgi:hypothetical protein